MFPHDVFNIFDGPCVACGWYYHGCNVCYKWVFPYFIFISLRLFHAVMHGWFLLSSWIIWNQVPSSDIDLCTWRGGNLWKGPSKWTLEGQWPQGDDPVPGAMKWEVNLKVKHFLLKSWWQGVVSLPADLNHQLWWSYEPLYLLIWMNKASCYQKFLQLIHWFKRDLLRGWMTFGVLFLGIILTDWPLLVSSASQIDSSPPAVNRYSLECYTCSC